MEQTEKTPILYRQRSEMIRVHTTRHGATYMLALLIHLGALLLLAFSLSTSSWLTGQAFGRTLSLGLWEACLDDTCQSFRGRGHKVVDAIGGWLEATQILAVIGFAVTALSLVVVGYVYIRELRNSHPKGLITAMVTTTAGAMVYWAALILFIYKSNYHFHLGEPYVDLSLGFSGFFGMIGAAAGLVVAVLYLLEYWRNVSRPSMGYVSLS